MKNPESKDEWIVDEPAAKVVRQIFGMRVSGLRPTQIAKRLRSEKVLTPTEYWNRIGRNGRILPRAISKKPSLKAKTA